uniref:Uncharacterized protein n=1 Tax=Avena sativa TaxID=4498 RepID=A0ACD5YWJ0_AVESA
MSVAAGVALAVADAVWDHIKAAGHATDEHLSILEHLFGKNMLRACKILDEGGVRRVTGAPSGRSLFLVMGESKRKEEYICFPEHLCTCYSFFYDIVGRGEQLCLSALPVLLWPHCSFSVSTSWQHGLQRLSDNTRRWR